MGEFDNLPMSSVPLKRARFREVTASFALKKSRPVDGDGFGLMSMPNYFELSGVSATTGRCRAYAAP
jgi:hypothetical protein